VEAARRLADRFGMNLEVRMLEFRDPIPDIAGLVCEELLAQSHYYRGRLTDDAQIVFLRPAGGRWHRIFVEAGLVFWQMVDGLDSPDQDRHHYTLTDLAAAHGLGGKRLVGATTVDRGAGGELHLLFEQGARVILEAVGGRSRVMVTAPAPA
jgi:hypothetical protein